MTAGDNPHSGETSFDSYFETLIEAVADARPVDWAAAHARVADPAQRDRVEDLRLLAVLAGVLDSSGQGTSHTLVSWPLMAERPEPLSVRPPDQSRFVLGESLGQGGFGVVYTAHDRARDMPVALKAFTKAGAESVSALKREFRVLADLTHPNLVALYELFAEDHAWFISMELVSGVDFLAYVRPTRDAFDFDRLGHALTQLCEALVYLHGHGKLHCDVKPSNVLVTETGHVKVVDFGLAVDLSATWTDAPQEVRGTPAYVAPEQLAGAAPSAASDWYGVGVMLFEAITGSRPFEGTVTEVLSAKQRQRPPHAHAAVAVPAGLEALCGRLLQPEPASRPSDVEVLGALADIWPTIGPARVVPPLRDTGPFVGRQKELAQLQDAFSRSANGLMQTVHLHGVSGMGKSVLVRRFVDALQPREPDTLVLEGRCSERESVPYKALDSLVDRLTQYLLTRPYEELLPLLPRDRAALGRLFPVLRRVSAIDIELRSVQIKDAQELRRRGGLAFRELLQRLAEKHRLVLIIDDLQWTDSDSATLLTEVLFEASAPPLLFVACYRTEEAGTGALASLLAAVSAAQRQGRCEVATIPIGELAPSEARELAFSLAPGEGAALSIEAIVEESGRSPLFIHQLMEYSAATAPAGIPALAWPVPATPSGSLTLDAVIRARAASFGDRARRLLQVLALFGGPLDLGMAGDVAGLGPIALNESVILKAAKLARARVTGAGEKLEAYHDRIREAILSEIPQAELRDLHGRMATALERVPETAPETLVHHFHGAGLDETAARFAVVAGDRAADALAFERASRSYRFALEFGRFGDGEQQIRTKLGDALAAGGRGYDAAQAYLDAARTATGRPAIELKRRASEQLLQGGHVDEGMVVVADVLQRAQLRLPDTPRRALLSLLFLRARIALRGLGFRERDERDIPPDMLVTVDTCWSVTTGLAIIDHIRSAEFGARHLLLALDAGEPLRVVRALAMELAYTSISGARSQPGNERLIAMAEPLAARVSNPEARALIILGRGSAAYMQGQWAMSRELCEQATEILRAQCTRVAWQIDTAQFYTLLVLFYMGEVGELTRRIPVLLKEARERDALYSETIVRTRLAYLACLAEDDVPAAEAAIRGGMERWSQQGFHNQHYYEMFAAAETRLYGGAGVAAWKGFELRWKALARTLLLRVQPILIESVHLRARTALAAAVDPASRGIDREALLRRADKDAERIRATGAAWADGLGHLVLAGTSAARADAPRAARHLVRAADIFQQERMGLHLAITRLRQGQLQGGAAGAALTDDARAWMRLQSIRNPDAFAQMLAPGLFASPPAAAS
jgi:hypothetical protein